MEKIKFRIDHETLAKMDAFYLSHAEITRTIARQIKNGRIPCNTGRCIKSGLTETVYPEISEDLFDVPVIAIRNAIVDYFLANEIKESMPVIEDSEVKYCGAF